MREKPVNPPEIPTDEELISYLDSELELQRSAEIEELLVSDPLTRSRMIDLQRTWDLLDQLPQTEPAGDFTRSTIELVLGKVQTDGRERLQIRRRWIGAAVMLALPLFTGAAAWIGVRNQQQQKIDALIRDLPVIQNVDAYREIPSIEFLEDLYYWEAFSMDVAPPEVKEETR